MPSPFPELLHCMLDVSGSRHCPGAAVTATPSPGHRRRHRGRVATLIGVARRGCRSDPRAEVGVIAGPQSPLWSLVVGRWSLVVGPWSFVGGRLSAVVMPWSLVVVG